MKTDIFHAFIALLKQTKPTITSGVSDPDAMEQEDG